MKLGGDVRMVKSAQADDVEIAGAFGGVSVGALVGRVVDAQECRQHRLSGFPEDRIDSHALVENNENVGLVVPLESGAVTSGQTSCVMLWAVSEFVGLGSDEAAPGSSQGADFFPDDSNLLLGWSRG